MSPIAILLLEDSDPDAERILAALSQDGPECRVRRARTREDFTAVLGEGPVDLILAGGAPAGFGVSAVLDVVQAVRPGVPVVVVPRHAGAEQAVDLFARGAAGYVPGDRLEQLGAAVCGAIEDGQRGADRRRAEAAIRFLAEAYREAVAAGRRKDEFLARVAHELRTPLNAMLGWASMLRTRRLDEAARARALETIERNARAEARLIDDLLDVSRMMTGTLRLDVMEVELCPAVASVVEALRPAAEAKAIALSAALDDTAGSVAGDPGRLRQVLRELIANAVRATSHGGHVAVRLARTGTQVEISVSDTGRGIPAEQLPRLFDGFWARATATGHGSLGVGLAIVRHLVEAHGGTVVAESPGEGLGATFTLRLPVLPDEWTERSPASHPPTSRPQPPSSSSRGREGKTPPGSLPLR